MTNVTNDSSDNLTLRNTIDQEDLNSNLVIRGLDISPETSAVELNEVYQGLRDFIGVSSDPEFDPVRIEVLKPNLKSKYLNRRPIVVRLKSSLAKNKFLQIRRAKKTIATSDIKYQQEHNRNIRVTEQLTKENQTLLYQAKSLRNIPEKNLKFKYVWSSDGQILARKKERSKVIRIKSLDHIKQLSIVTNHG